MESAQLHIERAERYLQQAYEITSRLTETDTLLAVQMFIDIADIENRIAQTQQMFRMHLTDTRPEVVGPLTMPE